MNAPLVLGGAAIGLLVGSFLGAVAMRLPRGEGVVLGRSRCDSCGRRLRACDLVPVLSFAWNRGRCSACGAAIDNLHLLSELGGAVVGAMAVLVPGAWPDSLLTALFGWQLLLLALLDGRHFWLPPPLLALLAATAAGLPALAGARGEAVASLALAQIMGGAFGFAVLAAPALAYRLLRKREGLGAADPWLLGAVGLWLGPAGTALALLLAAAAGLAAALAMRLAGRAVAADSALPLGCLMALSAFAIHMVLPLA